MTDRVGTREPGGRPRYGSAGEAVGAMLSGDYRVLGNLLLITILVLGLLIGAVWGLLGIARHSGLKPSVMELSSSPRVVLQQVTENGREYRILVSSAASRTAWQNTGIEIGPGDHVEVEAEGRVNINLYGLIEHVERRHAIEARIQSEFGPASHDTLLPERHYTKPDRQALAVQRGWTGPDGYEGIQDAAYPRRTENKLLPAAPFGMLLGAVHPGADEPSRREVKEVGARWGTDWTGPAGTLWFAINDVWDGADRDFPEKFYVDNIGFFVVRVEIRRKE